MAPPVPQVIDPAVSKHWRRGLRHAVSEIRSHTDDLDRQANAKVSQRDPAKVLDPLAKELRHYAAVIERVVSGPTKES